MDDVSASPWADVPSSPPSSSRPRTPSSIRSSLELASATPSPLKPAHQPSPLVDQASFPSPVFEDPPQEKEAAEVELDQVEDEDDGFDNFDDPPPPGAPAEDTFGGDDDFGDFGDFEEDAGGEGFDSVELEGGDDGDFDSPPPPTAVPAPPPPPPSYVGRLLKSYLARDKPSSRFPCPPCSSPFTSRPSPTLRPSPRPSSGSSRPSSQISTPRFRWAQRTSGRCQDWARFSSMRKGELDPSLFPLA